MARKYAILAVLCLALFAAYAAPLSGQLNLVAQSALYKTTTVHMAWQV